MSQTVLIAKFSEMMFWPRISNYASMKSTFNSTNVMRNQFPNHVEKPYSLLGNQIFRKQNMLESRSFCKRYLDENVTQKVNLTPRVQRHDHKSFMHTSSGSTENHSSPKKILIFKIESIRCEDPNAIARFKLIIDDKSNPITVKNEFEKGMRNQNLYRNRAIALKDVPKETSKKDSKDGTDEQMETNRKVQQKKFHTPKHKRAAKFQTNRKLSLNDE